MDIEKIQTKLKSLDAEHPGINHSIEAYVFVDHVEFAVSTTENMANGGVIEGLGDQFDSLTDLQKWYESGAKPKLVGGNDTNSH